MGTVTKEAIAGLVGKLRFPEPGPYDQDWEYTVADATRISELVGEYARREDLTDDERFTLMIIIIESFNDALKSASPVETDWVGIEMLLKRDRALHQRTLDYYAMLDETDLNNTWHVTPRIRKILDSRLR